MRRKFLAVILIVFACTVGGMAAAYADNSDENLSIQIEPFLDGQAKEHRWLPVKITLTNDGDAMIEGYVSIQVASSDQTGDSVIAKHVELAAGSSKVIWMKLPSGTYRANNNVVKFMSGSLPDGEEIKFNNGSTYVTSQLAETNQLHVGVLSENPDTFNYLELIHNQQIQLKVFPLQAEDMPERLLMLDTLDVLAINDYNSQQLNDAQVDAIGQWVERGGQLILTGGAGYPKTAAAFSEWAPVEYRGTTESDQLFSLQDYADDELLMSSPMTLSEVSVKENAEVLVENEGENPLPLFVKQSVGKGSVLYGAYNVALQPLAGWGGNTDLWGQLISPERNDVYGLGNTVGRNQMFYDFQWELNSALDFFQQLEPPSLGVLSLIFFIYVLIVAPLLYLVLKIWDKRGWSWWLVPSLAIVFSLAIYGIGAAERGSTLAQELNIIELHGDGRGYKTTAASFFVPNGGDYAVTLQKGETPAFFSQRFAPPTNQALNGSIGQWVSTSGDLQSVNFSDVSFWSIRKAWIEDSKVKNYGKFDITWDRSDQGIQGQVTNQTGTDLQHVHFMMNMEVTSIGDLKAGESASFRLNPTRSPMHFRNIAYTIFPNNGAQGENVHLRALLSSAVSKMGNRINEPMVIGFSESTEPTMEVDGETVQSDQYSVWLQLMQMSFVQGDEIYIPFGHIQAHIKDNQLSHLSQEAPDRIEAGAGSLVFEYRLPAIENAIYEQLEVNYWIDQNMQLQIWNQGTGEWEPFSGQGNQSTFTDPGSYFVQDQVVRMKMEKQMEYGGFQFPEIELTGRIAQ